MWNGVEMKDEIGDHSDTSFFDLEHERIGTNAQTRNGLYLP